MRPSAPASYEMDPCRIGTEGETIIFLHGETGPKGAETFLSALAQTSIVLSPTLPGYDLSPVPAWLDDMQDLALFFRDWIARQGDRRFHLVGHSLGGWLATEIALLGCSNMASLTLVAPGGLRHPTLRMFDIFMNALPDVARVSVHEAGLRERLMAECDNAETTDLRLQNRFMTARLAWQPRFFSPRLEKWMHRIDVPAQIIWGSDDNILPAGFASGFEARLPGAQTHILHSCGHHPPMEKPDALAHLVVKFAEEHAS
jgi:pimeloyl-ACP methyl ester carboxylesterase